MKDKINQHFNMFFTITKNAEFTVNSRKIEIQEWFSNVLDNLNIIKSQGKKLFFIGNGASASISAHFAADFTKNGNLPSMTPIEGALLTCFSNDYSYEDAYMEILKKMMNEGDGLIAISSSGSSRNLLNAVEFVKENYLNSSIITLTSFSPDNPLRKLGNYNLYLRSDEYSFAESGHAYYLHLLTDLFCNQETKNKEMIKVSETMSKLLKTVDSIK